MPGPSPIEWTDATWNPIVGCSIVSPGCTNCYAMKMAARIEAMTAELRSQGKAGAPHYDGTTKRVKGNAVWTGKLEFAGDRILTEPLRWKKPRRIFVNSMGDLLHEDAPEDTIDRVFAVMALCPQHTFQILTKRAERMREYFSRAAAEPVELRVWKEQFAVQPRAGHAHFDWPLPNVWLGVSAERQQEADERIPELLATPAAVRFVSLEPLLGPIDIAKFMWPVHARWPGAYRSPDEAKAAGAEVTYHRQALVWAEARFLNWVIVGGESGPNARPMNPQWARDIRDQCVAAGTAFFHKQNGEFASVSEVEGPGAHHTFPDHRTVRRVGKKLAGRTLDGRTWDEFPAAREAAP